MVRKLGFIGLGILVLCGLILSGCTKKQPPDADFAPTRKDGPPPSHLDIDVTRIANATPKKEKLSPYGNPASYNVWGKKYYVMPHKRAKNYKAKGFASWYGTKFHRKRTSSGEPYNMFHMTAAHTSLPIPSYAQVTNLRNGKKIIVKINDRGPFHGNRIIDLSYVAAKKLEIMGKGTGMVQVEAIQVASNHDISVKEITEKTLAKTTKMSPYSIKDKKLYLQVGSFSKRANAESLMRKVKSKIKNIDEHPVKVIANNSPKRTFRVQIGPFANVALSQSFSEKLRLAGIDAKIIGNSLTLVN